MSVRSGWRLPFPVFGSNGFSPPVRSASGRLQLLTPNEPYASSWLCQACDLPVHDLLVKFLEKSGRELILLLVERFSSFSSFFVRLLHWTFTGTSSSGLARRKALFAIFFKNVGIPARGRFSWLSRRVRIIPIIDYFLTPEGIYARTVR